MWCHVIGCIILLQWRNKAVWICLWWVENLKATTNQAKKIKHLARFVSSDSPSCSFLLNKISVCVGMKKTQNPLIASKFLFPFTINVVFIVHRPIFFTWISHEKCHHFKLRKEFSPVIHSEIHVKISHDGLLYLISFRSLHELNMRIYVNLKFMWKLMRRYYTCVHICR